MIIDDCLQIETGSDEVKNLFSHSIVAMLGVRAMEDNEFSCLLGWLRTFPLQSQVRRNIFVMLTTDHSVCRPPQLWS